MLSLLRWLFPFTILTWSTTCLSVSDSPPRTSNQQFLQFLGVRESDASPAAQYPVGTSTSRDAATLEVETFGVENSRVYYTNVALGTPAQPFRALLDFTFSGLFVRSTTCPEHDCSGGFSYDISKSSTAKSLDQRFKRRPESWNIKGSVATDVLHLAGMQVPNATFGFIDQYFGDDLFYYVLGEVVDGAIGLAPASANTSAYPPSTAPNTLHDLLGEGAAKRNVLTLSLPQEVFQSGSLRIGSVPDFESDQIARVPFGNSTAPELVDTFHVPLKAVSFGHDAALQFNFSAFYARVDLGSAIALPDRVMDRIMVAFDATPSEWFSGIEMNCDAWEALPDLRLELDGHSIVLSKEEYGSAILTEEKQYCVVHAVSAGKGADMASLGAVVLKKFHAVFDLDSCELGLVKRL